MAKGPYRASEGFYGSRGLSGAKGKLKSAQGKMSSAHGTTGQSKDNNMSQGGRGIFGDCKFSASGVYKQAGPKSFPNNAKQPSGHKDKA